jgi:hypothetical protein
MPAQDIRELGFTILTEGLSPSPPAQFLFGHLTAGAPSFVQNVEPVEHFKTGRPRVHATGK